MKRIWEWYGIAVTFLIGLLVVLLVAFKVCGWFGADPLSRMLNGPTVGLLLAAIGLLAVVCVILSGKRPWEPDLPLAGKFLLLGGAVGLLFIGCALWVLWHSSNGGEVAQTTVLAVQTLVLAVTAGFVVWYAAAAHRQAEIMTDQFDVQCTPHLRPRVGRPDPANDAVIVRLENLAGAAAIHPGVYPEWTKPHNGNAELIREPDDGPTPCLPTGNYFTCPVIQVGEVWLCRVRTPRSDECGKVAVRWLEQPWGERHKHEHIWTLTSNPEKPEEWHFEYGPEE